jgi:hypothetical protein
VSACLARDPESKRDYVNAHRLFKIIGKMKKARRSQFHSIAAEAASEKVN